MVLKNLKKAGAFTLALTLVIGTVQFPVNAAGDSNVIEKGENLSLPSVNAGETVRFCADYEQIIGEDGTVYTPLEDKVVKGFFETTGEDSETSVKTDEVTYTVRGEYKADPDANEKPAVIPELQEWHGKKGTFVLSAASKIVIASEDLRDLAEVFQEDYQEMTGMKIKEIKKGTKAEAKMCDFYFGLTEDENGLGKEGYTMDIDDFVSVEAETATGAYWATRSILQILKQTSGSMPKGLVRDYPKFEVRGFSLDIGRKPFTLEAVKEFAENMAWYKMNSFQVHLNDNLIFHEDYSTLAEAKEQSYAGFRLESGVVNEETGKSATSEDVSFTKDEFRAFIQDCRIMGIDVVPELDMPAHALAFTRTFPEYMSDRAGGGHSYLIEELDLSKDYDGALNLAESLWNDYFDDDNPVFDENMTVHIGTDEFHGDTELFRKFSDDMIKFIQSKNRKVRVWGSLTRKNGTTDVTSKDVQINVWNKSWSDPTAMYNDGFDLINTLDTSLYMVPNGTGGRGGYNDYLNVSSLYNSWRPENFSGTQIPAGCDQMLGACYAIWHDNIDTRANGISQYDSFDRFFDALPVISAKVWGEAEDRDYGEFVDVSAKTGTAPGTKIRGDVDYVTSTIADYTFDGTVTADSSKNKFNLSDPVNAEQVNSTSGKALKLKGEGSYAETPEVLDLIGDSAVLTMKVKMDAEAEGEQILCESKTEFDAYGAYAFKAVQVNTGKVGFSREGYDYSFDYTLPKGEWVELTFVSGQNQVALYVNGELIDNDPDIYFANHPTTELSQMIKNRDMKKVSTMLVPLGRIGSRTKSFQGEIDFVTVTGKMKSSGQYGAIPHSEMTAEACSVAPSTAVEGPAQYAIDSKDYTYWHTNWNNDLTINDDHHWFKVTLTNPKTISKLSYLPRQDSSNGRIFKYSIEAEAVNPDGTTTAKTLVDNGTWEDNADRKTVEFESTEVKSITLKIHEAQENDVGAHATIAELNLYESFTIEDVKADLEECLRTSAGSDQRNNYTDQSWHAFQEAKEKAEQMLNNSNSTVEDCLYVYENLQQAIDALTELDFMEPAAKDHYNLVAAVIETEEQLKALEGTSAEEALKAALQAAKAALEQESGSADDLSDLLSNLQSAGNVDKIRGEAKGKLTQTISDAKKKLSNTAGYTQASVKALQDAVTAAENLLANPDVMIKDLESAAENLDKLSLVKEPPKQDTGLKDNDPFEKDGMKYQVVSASALTAKLVKGTDTAKPTIDTVSYNGKTYKIVEIGTAAFSGCKKKLKKVTIGPDVAVIGKNAFKGCKKLANVVVKNNSKLTKVGGGAFKKTSSKIKIKLPKNLKKNKKLKKQLKKAGIKKGL